MTVTAEATRLDRSRAGKYLSFQLGREEYAIQVLRVREIMGLQDITVVPQTPDYVKGVINLRGKVIPVIDLRLKFGLPPAEYNHRTCVIVVQIPAAHGSTLMGVVVDAVSEVLNLTEPEIEDTPEMGPGISMPYILGMAKVKERVKILLAIEDVLNTQEFRGIQSLIE